MHQQINEEKLIAIFVTVDDFVNLFDEWLVSRALQPSKQATRQTDLSTSELITLVVYYHHSGYKNFQYYYQRLVLTTMRPYFPHLVSYQRLIDLLPRLVVVLHVLTKYLCLLSKRTGCYFADSKNCPFVTTSAFTVIRFSNTWLSAVNHQRAGSMDSNCTWLLMS